MGRLWQTLILSKWHDVFINIPVESLVYQHQEDYYSAIRNSTRQTDCSPFIDFILQMIVDAIGESTSVESNNTDANVGLNAGLNVGLKLSELDKAILACIAAEAYITNAVLAEKLGKSVRSIERRIKMLKDNQLLERVGAKKTGYWKLIEVNK